MLTQVVLALKPFAPVKDAHLAVHPTTNASLRACYVEFQSVEHAQHTLDTASVEGDGGLTIEGEPASLSYAASGAAPASAAAALAALSADNEEEEEEGRIVAPVSASSVTALRAFQGRQNAARLAKLEGGEAATAGGGGAAAAAASGANSEAAAARARRARVDTGSGAGMGSLALAFGGGGPGSGGVGGDAGGGGGRGVMAVVTLGGAAGSEGASPEVDRLCFARCRGRDRLWCCDAGVGRQWCLFGRGCPGRVTRGGESSFFFVLVEFRCFYRGTVPRASTVEWCRVLLLWSGA